MKPLGSLRVRLLLGGAAWIVVALIAAWAFIVANFAFLIETERRADLQASFDRIVAEIDPDVANPVSESALTDPRYDTPLGGLYWQVEDLESGDLVRSRSLWDIELPDFASPDGRASLRQLRTGDGTTLIALGQRISVARSDGTSRPMFVIVAEEREAQDDPVVRFGKTLALYLGVLAIVLLGAMIAQVSLGLRPLSILREQIAAIRRGEAERLPDGPITELRPLTEQVNDLLEAQEETINFARERAADLAHGLKTPLAVLGATADRLREQGDTANGDVLRVLTEQMNARTDYQLRIARLRFRTRAQGVHASLNDAVLRSVAVLRKGHDAERIKWTVDLEHQLEIDIDAHDLMELVGILLENASQWAREKIIVRGSRGDAQVLFTVEDDGDGLTNEQIARLGKRGVRLDERSRGEGLGLSIAFEILRFNRGTIELGRSPAGGLRSEVRLPASGSNAN